MGSIRGLPPILEVYTMNSPTKPGAPPPGAPQSKSSADQQADLTLAQAPLPSNVDPAKPGHEDTCDFVEGCEDPRQSEELERQQDA